MQKEIKDKGIAFGQMKRIAAAAGASAFTVRKVLTNQLGVSEAMRKRVAKATTKIQREAARQQDKWNSQFINPHESDT